MNDQVRWKDMTHEQRQEYAAVKNREYRQRLKEMYGTTRPKRGQQPLLRKPTIDPKQLKMPRISQFTFQGTMRDLEKQLPENTDIGTLRYRFKKIPIQQRPPYDVYLRQFINNEPS